MYNATTMMQVTTAPRAPKETKKEGFILGVYYGAHAKSTPIFVDVKEINKVVASEGTSGTFTLTTEHGKETAMIKDIARHPVKNNITHVDFYILEKGQKAHVKLPIIFVGESQAVKDGGVLVKVLHELSVEGEPSALPHEVTADTSLLATEASNIFVKDIALPKGVTLYHVNTDDVVASISVAEELGEIATIDLSAIEVEKKGKKEEDETK